MPLPVHHVRAGNMGIYESSDVLVYVVQVISTLIIICGVGVTGKTNTRARMRQMVGQPVIQAGVSGS
jgi:hypothetical protein